MATIKIQSKAAWTNKQATTTSNILTKWFTLVDSQAERKTMWFMIALVFQGVFFLPLPAMLIYYFNAPTIILAVTLGLFFANIITGMSGSSIRTMLNLFAISIVAHLLLLITFIL